MPYWIYGRDRETDTSADPFFSESDNDSAARFEPENQGARVESDVRHIDKTQPQKKRRQEPQTSRSRQWQISLRQLFIAMALLGVILIWQLPKLERRWARQQDARQQADVTAKIMQFKAEIEKTGDVLNTSPNGWVANVVFMDPETVESFPKIEERIDRFHELGWPGRDPNAWHTVVSFWNPKTEVTDAHLVHIQDLIHLRYLMLMGARVNITDRGLMHLQDLSQLQILELYGNTEITDNGLVYLRGLTNLEELNLGLTQVTDGGLINLKDMKKLKRLDLNDSFKVADAGLIHLQGLTNLHTLNLDCTRVTNAGLLHLRNLSKLRNLYLSETTVTEKGIDNLRAALPKCRITH